MKKQAFNQSLFKRLNVEPNKRNTLLGCLFLVIAAGFLVYNAFYGLSNPDESFYLTVPYRVLKGDALFVNEWHVSQLSAVLQYPFVWLYVTITGSGDGMILFFRLLFIFFQTGVAVFAFVKLRKYGFISALLGALLFVLYTPEYVLALSYFTLSLLPWAVIGILIITEKHLSPIKLIIIGILWACAVLAEPSMIVTFLVYFGFILFHKISKRLQNPLLSFKSFGFIAIGIGIVTVYFLVFVFSRESVGELLHALPNIFKSGEYSGQTLFMGFIDFFVSLFRDFSVLAIAMGIYLLVIIFDKNKDKRKLIYAVIGLIIAVLSLIIAVSKVLESGKLAAFTNLPFIIAFMGMSAYILLKNKRKELLLLWLFGLAYAFCRAITSEAMGYDGSYGFVISDLASVPLMFDLFSELSGERKSKDKNGRKEQRAVKISTIISIALCFSIIGIYAGVMLTRDPPMVVFYNKPPVTNTQKIEKGAYKNIRISPEYKVWYDAYLKDIEYIETHTTGQYTVMTDSAWCILSSDRAPLAFTHWYIPGIESTYTDYYRSVGKIPKYIYIGQHWLYGWKPGEAFSVDTSVEYFSKVFDCEVIQGEAGTVLKIDGYKG